MGMFDDNGPNTNLWVNMALFKVPSTKPPGQLAEEMAPALGILAAAGLAGAGVYGVYQALKPDPAPPPAAVRIDESAGSRQHFSEYSRVPKAACLEEFRALSEAHDYFAALLRRSAPGDAVSRNFFDDQQVLADLSNRAEIVSADATQALGTLQREKVDVSAHEGGLMLLRTVLRDLPKLAQPPSGDPSQRFMLESAQATVRDVLFCISTR